MDLRIILHFLAHFVQYLNILDPSIPLCHKIEHFECKKELRIFLHDKCAQIYWKLR